MNDPPDMYITCLTGQFSFPHLYWTTLTGWPSAQLAYGVVSVSFTSSPREDLKADIPVAHHRAENFYGEAHARLERDHYVFGQPTIRRSWIMTAIFYLFFGIPARTNNALEALYVDDAVYGIHWQKFMSNMIDSWKDSRLMVRRTPHILAYRTVLTLRDVCRQLFQ